MVEELEWVLGNLDSISGSAKSFILSMLLFCSIQVAAINKSLPGMQQG